jgi:hypothetical protein
LGIRSRLICKYLRLPLQVEDEDIIITPGLCPYIKYRRIVCSPPHLLPVVHCTPKTPPALEVVSRTTDCLFIHTQSTSRPNKHHCGPPRVPRSRVDLLAVYTNDLYSDCTVEKYLPVCGDDVESKERNRTKRRKGSRTLHHITRRNTSYALPSETKNSHPSGICTFLSGWFHSIVLFKLPHMIVFILVPLP